MPTPLADRAIAYWTDRVQLYDTQVAAGLLRSDAMCLIYARAALRACTDIDGDPWPAA